MKSTPFLAWQIAFLVEQKVIEEISAIVLFIHSSNRNFYYTVTLMKERLHKSKNIPDVIFKTTLYNYIRIKMKIILKHNIQVDLKLKY